jgi:hypothetical protein
MKRAKLDGEAAKKQKCEEMNLVIPILLNYLPGPIFSTFAQVCSTWRTLVLDNVETYCNDLCHHHDMCMEHRCCLYQIYDFWQRGFITRERYNALRLRWRFTDEYLLERGGIMWMPEVGDMESFTPIVERVFNLYSYHGRGINGEFSLRLCDADETEFISIPLYKKVFQAPILTVANVSLENLLQARVPIPVIESLIVEKKISRYWLNQADEIPVDHTAKLFRSPYEPQLRKINSYWPNATINWCRTRISRYLPVLEALVETVAGLRLFLTLYNDGLDDESLEKLLDLAPKEPMDFSSIDVSFKLEKMLDARGLLSLTHWDQYFRFVLSQADGDIMRAKYLLESRKFHHVVTQMFKDEVSKLPMWFYNLMRNASRSISWLPIDADSDDVLFFIKQLAQTVPVRVYQDLVGLVYFPGPASPDLLIYEPIVERELASYNYLWLQNARK